MRDTRRLRLWPLFGLVIVLGAAGSVLVAVAVARDRGQVSDVVQAVTSVLAPTGGLALWLWTRRHREPPLPADTLAHAADALARAVREQWQRAAGERHLRHPAQIPLRWRWSQRAVTGPAHEALGSPGQARFAPLPGMAAATLATVDDGGLQDLAAVYGGLDSGRVILLGDAGTGKSAAAILTLLDALDHRQNLDAAQRAQTPVPVLLTAHGWDPHRQRLGEWLAVRLEAEYPFLRSDAHGHHTAARLVHGGRVALILDGFDEIADDLRPAAIGAMDQQATFRLMVLTRTRELTDAVAGGHLHGAAALELLPVPAQDAADYLIRCRVQPPPPAWQRLAEHLRAAPDSAVSAELDNPLMLTLVRDTFSVPAEVDDLLTPGRFATRAAVEGHLLDRVLPAAYRPRPGQSPPPYTLDQATRWLGYLATEMNHRDTRDLAWWHLHQWAPAPFRVVTMALPPALGLGFAAGTLFWYLFGLPAGIAVGLMAGSANGIAMGMALGLREGNPRTDVRWRTWLRWKEATWSLEGALAGGVASGGAAAVTVGLARGATAGVAIGLGVALTFGLASGTVEGLLRGRRSAGPRRMKRLRWSALLSRANLAFGLGFGFTYVFYFGITSGLTSGLAAGFMGGFALGLVCAFVFALINALVQASPDATSPMDPITCWRNDLRSGLAEGLAFGLAVALALALVGWRTGTIEEGLALGVTAGLGEGTAFTLSVSHAWIAMRGFLLLRCAGLFPRRALRFLEDARERGVLRTVGSVYQFRHARLQDQLATTRGGTPDGSVNHVDSCVGASSPRNICGQFLELGQSAVEQKVDPSVSTRLRSRRGWGVEPRRAVAAIQIPAPWREDRGVVLSVLDSSGFGNGWATARPR
jgi:hypothetical protein